jgi:hypothetical protein
VSGPINPRGGRYLVPTNGTIGPVRRNLLERAKAWLGGTATQVGQNVDYANALLSSGIRTGAGMLRNPGIDMGPGEMLGLQSGGEALVDSSNGLPLVRMERGLESLQVDPRVVDAAGVVALPAVPLARAAAGGVKQASEEFLEASAKAGGQIIAGPKSKTADLKMLKRAQELDDRLQMGGNPKMEGQKRDLIYRETGWWKGKDGQWRYWLDDSQAKLTDQMLESQYVEGRPMTTVMQHDALYDAYPGLMQDKVDTVQLDPLRVRAGQYSGATGAISMRAPDADSLRKGVLHELNHAVQAEEGFAPGGNPEYASELVRKRLENDPYLPPEQQLPLADHAFLMSLVDKPRAAYRSLSGEAESRLVELLSDVAPSRARKPYKSFDVPEDKQLVLTGERDRPVQMAADGSDAPSSMLPARARPATVNIGLKVGETGVMDPEEALSALRALGVEVKRSEIRQSGTEPTLIAALDRPLTPEQGNQVSTLLQQEAIAQKVGKKGELYGPAAEKWGPFNNDFFLELDKQRGAKVDNKTARAMVGDEEDVARSLISAADGGVAKADIGAALVNRARYRAEPNATPGPEASEAEWAAFGDAHGVDMKVAPSKEVATGLSIPGGLDGTFSIPDLFVLKSMKIDPATLSRDVHDKLMQKLIRTYDIKDPDPVDVFNRLAFAQLSPNAPLLQNEFLMQRLRATSLEDIQRLASRDGQAELSALLDKESGVGAAGRGGLGVKGTAELENLAKLARAVLAKPEMFRAQGGETLRDVAVRVMNQVPGLGPKTASLGVPWLDLNKANVSAVDLHMIRNNYERLLSDPEVGAGFVERMAKLLKVDPTLEAVRSKMISDPNGAEKAAINIIGGTQRARVYRGKKSGEVNPEVPASLSPDKLLFEPEKAKGFNEFYEKVVSYVDESRGANPTLELFPEQWRLWDTYRGRVEPHEFAHPDWRKLPKQSFTEMQRALASNREAGFADSFDPFEVGQDAPAPKKKGKGPKRSKQDWRQLYYGQANPELLAAIAAAGGGAAAFPLLRDEE